jgi:hypothetical protein
MRFLLSMFLGGAAAMSSPLQADNERALVHALVESAGNSGLFMGNLERGFTGYAEALKTYGYPDERFDMLLNNQWKGFCERFCQLEDGRAACHSSVNVSTEGLSEDLQKLKQGRGIGDEKSSVQRVNAAFINDDSTPQEKKDGEIAFASKWDRPCTELCTSTLTKDKTTGLWRFVGSSVWTIAQKRPPQMGHDESLEDYYDTIPSLLPPEHHYVTTGDFDASDDWAKTCHYDCSKQSAISHLNMDEDALYDFRETRCGKVEKMVFDPRKFTGTTTEGTSFCVDRCEFRKEDAKGVAKTILDKAIAIKWQETEKEALEYGLGEVGKEEQAKALEIKKKEECKKSTNDKLIAQRASTACDGKQQALDKARQEQVDLLTNGREANENLTKWIGFAKLVREQAQWIEDERNARTSGFSSALTGLAEARAVKKEWEGLKNALERAHGLYKDVKTIGADLSEMWKEGIDDLLDSALLKIKGVHSGIFDGKLGTKNLKGLKSHSEELDKTMKGIKEKLASMQPAPCNDLLGEIQAISTPIEEKTSKAIKKKKDLLKHGTEKIEALQCVDASFKIEQIPTAEEQFFVPRPAEGCTPLTLATAAWDENNPSLMDPVSMEGHPAFPEGKLPEGRASCFCNLKYWCEDGIDEGGVCVPPESHLPTETYVVEKLSWVEVQLTFVRGIAVGTDAASKAKEAEIARLETELAECRKIEADKETALEDKLRKTGAELIALYFQASKIKEKHGKIEGALTTTTVTLTALLETQSTFESFQGKVQKACKIECLCLKGTVQGCELPASELSTFVWPSAKPRCCLKYEEMMQEWGTSSDCEKRDDHHPPRNCNQDAGKYTPPVA